MISSGKDFVAFWRQYVSNRDAVPGVDFTTHTVLAVFPGAQPTSGYTTTVVSIRRTNRQLRVSYRVTAPSSGAVPANFTPVHIVVVPLSRLRGDFDTVTFERVP